jgi:hypothetical protein
MGRCGIDQSKDAVMTHAPTAPRASFGTTTEVSGAWSWVSVSYAQTPLDDGCILAAGTRAGTWTGTLEGSSYDVFEMTWAPPFGDRVHGAAWGTLTAVFTGRVGGRNGSLTVLLSMREPADDALLSGTWVIASGTKGLRYVRGSGTWIGSGVDSSATYDGTIHRTALRRSRTVRCVARAGSPVTSR